MHDDAPNQNTTPETPPAPTGPNPLEMTKTSISRIWAGKWIAIIVVFLGLAAWGWVDATIVYPARGQKHIDFARRDYLTLLRDSSPISFSAEGTSVEDPEAEMIRLKNSGGQLTAIDAAKKEWLDALSRLHSLAAVARENRAELERRANGEEAQPTRTLFVNPRTHLTELTTRLEEAGAPKPLNPIDMTIQWGFVAVGLAGGIPVLFLFFARARKSYRYDPDSRTVTFPDGTKVSPQNLTGWDKRDWHKFYIWITLEGEDHERKVDLYPYTPLEAWLVDAYEHSPIYEPEDEPEDEDEDADTGTSESDEPDRRESDG